MNYQKLVEASNGLFTIDDLWVGKRLADGCYNSHHSQEFSTHSLGLSSVANDDSMYEREHTTKDAYWEKIRSFNKQQLDDYFEALYAFCASFGYE